MLTTVVWKFHYIYTLTTKMFSAIIFVKIRLVTKIFVTNYFRCWKYSWRNFWQAICRRSQAQLRNCSPFWDIILMFCQCSAFGHVNLELRFVLSSRNLSEHCGESPLNSLDLRKTCKDKLLKYVRVFHVSWTIFTFQAPNQTYFTENALSQPHK